MVIVRTHIKAASLTAVLKVESITKLPVVELNAVQATKSRPKNGAKSFHFRETADKEINVSEVTVEK